MLAKLRSHKRHWLKIAIYFLLFFAVGEGYLRWRGYDVSRMEFDWKDSRKVMYDRDPDLCRLEVMRPGRPLVLSQLSNEFVLNTSSDRGMVVAMRPSRPLVLAPRPYKALVLGCSCAFGLGVATEEGFVWKLNELMPNCEFDNGSRIGAGTFSRANAVRCLKGYRKYDLVIYVAIDNHKYRERAVHSFVAPGRDSSCCPWGACYRTGYYDKDQDMCLWTYEPLWETKWPGDRVSCLINFSRNAFWEFWYGYIRFHLDPDYDKRRMAKAIRAINLSAKEMGARFGIVNIYGFGEGEFATYARLPLWEGDKTEPVPVCDANYPLDYLKSALHTPRGTNGSVYSRTKTPKRHCARS